MKYTIRENDESLTIILEDGTEISVQDIGPRVEVFVPDQVDVHLLESDGVPRYKTNLVYFREMRKRSYKWTNLKKLVRELSTKSVFGGLDDDAEGDYHDRQKDAYARAGVD